jgi:hypothetical protein
MKRESVYGTVFNGKKNISDDQTKLFESTNFTITNTLHTIDDTKLPRQKSFIYSTITNKYYTFIVVKKSSKPKPKNMLT